MVEQQPYFGHHLRHMLGSEPILPVGGEEFAQALEQLQVLGERSRDIRLEDFEYAALALSRLGITPSERKDGADAGFAHYAGVEFDAESPQPRPQLFRYDRADARRSYVRHPVLQLGQRVPQRIAQMPLPRDDLAQLLNRRHL